jgi:hypothetical protein
VSQLAIVCETAHLTAGNPALCRASDAGNRPKGASGSSPDRRSGPRLLLPRRTGRERRHRESALAS